MLMCSSKSEEVEAQISHFSGEDHDTLYSQNYTPADLRPRLTLLVHASTIILFAHSCWSAEEKSLSAKIELKIERAGNSKSKSLLDSIESTGGFLKRYEKRALHQMLCSLISCHGIEEQAEREKSRRLLHRTKAGISYMSQDSPSFHC